jgi:hypothetical protein
MEIMTTPAGKLIFLLGDTSVEAYVHKDALVIDSIQIGKSALLLLGSILPNTVMCQLKSSGEISNQIRVLAKRPLGTSRILSDNRPLVHNASTVHTSYLKQQIAERHIRTELRLLPGMQKDTSVAVVDNTPPDFLSFVHFLRSVYFDKSDGSECDVCAVILRGITDIERESACITFGALIGSNPYEVIIPAGCLYPELRAKFKEAMDSIKVC